MYNIPKEATKALARALVQRRQQLNLTPAQVCERVGMEEYQLEYLESGEARQIGREDLRFVGIGLGGIADDLFAACGWDPEEIRTSEIVGSLRHAGRSLVTVGGRTSVTT